MAKVQCPFHLVKLAPSLIIVFRFIGHENLEREIFSKHFSKQEHFPIGGKKETIKLPQMPPGTWR